MLRDKPRDKSKDINIFLFFNLIIKLFSNLTPNFSSNKHHKSHILSFKGCARPSSAWKLTRKGAASFFIFFVLLLLVTISTAIPEATTDKSDYVLGNKVMINVDNATNDSTLKIIEGENIYKFIGELNHEMGFLPLNTGKYVVSLEYEDDQGLTKEVTTSFIVNPQTEVSQTESSQPPSTAESNTMQGTYGASALKKEIQKPVIFDLADLEQVQGITISNDWLVIKNHNQEAIDKKMQLFDLKAGKKYSTAQDATHNPIGPYDTEVSLDNHPIKKILFRDLEARGNSNIELRIDDLSGNVAKAGSTSQQFYVIDPTSLNFTSATVTVTAKGHALRKCKDWNYTKQRCEGTWEYVMSLTPGQNYTFLLTPEDPAYNETTHDADNCYIEATACISTEITSISADGGGTIPFNKRSNEVRVSFTNESSTIGTIVDCTVYVDGYDNEGNRWTLQLGNWSTLTWDDAGSGQVAPSPEGTISGDCISHFGTSNDESLFDDFAVRITTNDGAATATAYIDYVYVTINFSIPDTIAPYYSSIVANPSSPATYSPTGSYQFNTTWQDNEGVNTTWIEHNFTGTMQNYTITTSTGNVYYYNYGNIGAGGYVWKMHSNDTAENINSSMPWQTYLINRASSSVNLLLNGTDGNFTVNNSGTVNVSGILETGQGNVTIYEKGVLIANGTSPQSIIRTYTSIGNYNITVVYYQTQNYTGNSETHYVIVQDTIAPGPVTLLNETKTGETWILWNWSNPGDADLDHLEIWLNGSFQTNVSETTEGINISGLLSDTGYEIQIRTADNWTTPNIGAFVNDTARTNVSADVTPPGIYNIKNSSITDTSVNITWDTNEEATSVIKYGTSPGSYTGTFENLSTTLNHTVILTGLNSSTTYYYVVNSSDPAGNSNQSIEYSFTTLADQTNPYYSNIVADPSSPATYNPSGSYQFNTTWQDNEQVDTVWIEHNFTGTMTNYTGTPLPNTSSIYYYNYGNIAAGGYAWKTHANDTTGNMNSSMPWQTYQVQKAASSVNLLLNGTDGDYSINESQSANITGILVTGQGNISLQENGSLINQGPSPLTNLTTYLMPGTYNISLVYDATENYTGNLEYYILTVNDTRAPWVNLTEPPNASTDVDGDVIFKFTVNDTSEVQNCSLYLNGTFNQEKEILTKGLNTFTVNDLNNGNYTWYVNCSDFANHDNVSQTFNLTVEINEFYPHITPVVCTDEDGCTVSNINGTPETWEEHGSLEKGATQTNYVYVNFSQPNIKAGSRIHWMYIVYDKYQDTTEGFLRLEWLNGTIWESICNTNYAIGGYHVHDSVNCSFSNETNMPTVSQINDGLQLRAEFYYSGSPSGKQYGTDQTYINLKYTEDVTPPTVELVGPSTYHRPGIVNFTYIPSDANLVNCTLYGDFDGSWGINLTDTDVTSTVKDNFTIDLDEGFYTWNVYCCDIAENCAFDEIGGPDGKGNYTVNITNPDFVIIDIGFNITSSQAKEGMNISINATILNQGNVNATEDFNVSFFLGDPDSGGTQINGNVTIEGLEVDENKTVNVTWTIDSGGPKNIYVIVDPPLATNGSVNETLEDNNKDNKTFHVDGYSYYNGVVENNLYLGNWDNDTLYYYLNVSNVTGNIFVTDVGSSITFSSLQAMGRDTSNLSAINDFNDTDTALSMTEFNDSIRWVFTQDTDIPTSTQSMIIFERQINNVPIVDSTNNSNFQTGMLWDMNDGGAQYSGTQDLVFVTEIHQKLLGTYGTYDYEVRIPTNLRDYIASGNDVVFYWEITGVT